MEITDVPFAVLRFQYQLARIPLQLIEEQVVAGMRSEAPTRLFYERWLGGLDATVGKMLGDPDLQKRGGALIERSDALRRAAQLDATATQNQEQAADELKVKRAKAIEDQKDARTVTERDVEEARTAAEERTGAAAAAAQKRSAAAKQQADELTAQRLTSAEAAQRGRAGQDHRGRAQSHRGCRIHAGRSSGKTQRRCQQARAGRPGRGIGRPREAETPI